ncbi:MAG: glycosyltransferase [Candidatus Omnitrophica bacterium]|nr:glycosyltransferase [Candidatus Omnitrophota bacterium]
MQSSSREKPENKISLFVPVYNPSGSIEEDIDRCYDTLLRLNGEFEIIIVDDNSNVKSPALEKAVSRINKRAGKQILRCIFYNIGPSRRENLAQSFSSAKFKTVGFIDSDFSCDISFVLKAINVLREESADIVIGSRYIKGSKVKSRIARRVLSFFYNSALRIIFKSKIKDHQCGLKVFRLDAVMPIIGQMGYDKEFIRGWFWDAELLIRVQRAGLRIIEMPVEWSYADSSTFRITRETRCLRAIIKLRRALG